MRQWSPKEPNKRCQMCLLWRQPSSHYKCWTVLKELQLNYLPTSDPNATSICPSHTSPRSIIHSSRRKHHTYQYIHELRSPIFPPLTQISEIQDIKHKIQQLLELMKTMMNLLTTVLTKMKTWTTPLASHYGTPAAWLNMRKSYAPKSPITYKLCPSQKLISPKRNYFKLSFYSA
jgi:hypothetical protein